MTVAAVIPWIQYSESVVAENDPSLVADVTNRPVKFLITQSDLLVTQAFPGFMVSYKGAAGPEGVQVAQPGTGYTDSTAGDFYVKVTGAGNVGWAKMIVAKTGYPVGALSSHRIATIGGTINTDSTLVFPPNAHKDLVTLRVDAPTITGTGFPDPINSGIGVALHVIGTPFALLGGNAIVGSALFQNGAVSFSNCSFMYIMNGTKLAFSADDSQSTHFLMQTIDSNTFRFSRSSSALGFGLMRIKRTSSGFNNYAAWFFGDSTFDGSATYTTVDNTFNTNGITIGQLEKTDEILSFKSSVIAHGITTIAETDTFGLFSKRVGTVGGLIVRGLIETSDPVGLQLDACVTDGKTTKGAADYGGILINSQKKSGTTVGAHAGNENLLVVANSGNALFFFDSDGDLLVSRQLVVGVPSSGNHDGAAGVTITDTAAATALRFNCPTQVAHGITTDMQLTECYGKIGIQNATDGGLRAAGATEQGIALDMVAIYTVGQTTKSNATQGGFNIEVYKKSGTSITNPAANENLVSVMSGNTTRFFLDADGDSHQDVGTAWTNFDTHDDVELLNLLSAHVTRHDDPLRRTFGKWLESAREELEKIELVQFNENGHHFVNMSRLTMLHTGAIRQLGNRLERIEYELQRLLPA